MMLLVPDPLAMVHFGRIGSSRPGLTDNCINQVGTVAGSEWLFVIADEALHYLSSRIYLPAPRTLACSISSTYDHLSSKLVPLHGISRSVFTTSILLGSYNYGLCLPLLLENLGHSIPLGFFINPEQRNL